MQKRIPALLAALLVLALAIPAQVEPEDARSRLQRLARQARNAPPPAEARIDSIPEPDLPDGMVRLTRSADEETAPVWAPDGNSIFFSSLGSGPTRILRLDIGGAAPDTIVAHQYFPAAEPAVSPDGAYLAYQSQRADTKRCIWIRRLADGLEGKLNEDRVVTESGVAWSHAGGTLYFSRLSSNSQYHRAMSSLRNGDALKVVGREQGDYFRPAVSPDGKEVAWIHRLDRESKIVIINNELNALSRDLYTPGYIIASMDWMPDGRRMVVSFMDLSDLNHGFDLGMLDTESGEIRFLLDLGHYDSDPRISPDGSRVVFSSNPGDAQDIYIWTLSAEPDVED